MENVYGKIFTQIFYYNTNEKHKSEKFLITNRTLK